jgi:hypothetical protein
MILDAQTSRITHITRDIDPNGIVVALSEQEH